MVGAGPRRDVKHWGCPRCDAKLTNAAPDAGDVEALLEIGRGAWNESNDAQRFGPEPSIGRMSNNLNAALLAVIHASAVREAQLRGALRRILDWMATGERLTPEQATAMVTAGEDALATPASPAAERYAALERVWSAHEALAAERAKDDIEYDEHRDVALDLEYTEAIEDLRAIDAKAVAAEDTPS